METAKVFASALSLRTFCFFRLRSFGCQLLDSVLESQYILKLFAFARLAITLESQNFGTFGFWLIVFFQFLVLYEVCIFQN